MCRFKTRGTKVSSLKSQVQSFLSKVSSLLGGQAGREGGPGVWTGPGERTGNRGEPLALWTGFLAGRGRFCGSGWAGLGRWPRSRGGAANQRRRGALWRGRLDSPMDLRAACGGQAAGGQALPVRAAAELLWCRKSAEDALGWCLPPTGGSRSWRRKVPTGLLLRVVAGRSSPALGVAAGWVERDGRARGAERPALGCRSERRWALRGSGGQVRRAGLRDWRCLFGRWPNEGEPQIS